MYNINVIILASTKKMFLRTVSRKLKQLPYRGCSSACQTPEVKDVVDYPNVNQSCDVDPVSSYGGRRVVTMLPGSGNGPAVMDSVREVLRRAGAPVDFEIVAVDEKSDKYDGFEHAILSTKRNRVAIKGCLDIGSDVTTLNRNAAIMEALDLYVKVTHIKSIPAIKTRFQNVDVVVIRQNTAREYNALEHENVNGVVECLQIVTRENCERVARFALEYARRNGRKQITVAHKGNLLKITDGLFSSTVEDIAKDYPDICVRNMLIDTCATQLIQHPSNFDVIVTFNVYGTILVHLLIGMVGGEGFASSKNFGDKYAIFENFVKCTDERQNPLGCINASCDMLSHLGLHNHVKRIRNAVHKTVNEDQILTPDMGGECSNEDLINQILEYVSQGDHRPWWGQNK